MASETLSLLNKQASRILLPVCAGVCVAVLLISTFTPATSLVLPTSTRSRVLPIAATRQVAASSNSRWTAVLPMPATQDQEVIISDEAPVSPALVGVVAAVSTFVGAAVMKFWGQRERSFTAEPIDLESSAIGASPMSFQTSAPWSSGSMLNTSTFSPDARANRLVLQAAKAGKGKGGGAKGKIAGIIKLALPAGKATPAPPVGPALGQYGLNIVAFCKEYNAATEKEAADGMIIPVEITAFEDRSYTFVLKTPPASVLLKKAAGVPSGSASPNKTKVGNITRAQLEEIAKTKLPDLNTADVAQAMKIVEGTAKNMGITIS